MSHIRIRHLLLAIAALAITCRGQIFFNSLGRVGIGTNAPTSPLQLAGDADVLQNWQSAQFSVTGASNDRIRVNIGVDTGTFVGVIPSGITQYSSPPTYTNLAINPFGGLVSIGTTTPGNIDLDWLSYKTHNYRDSDTLPDFAGTPRNVYASSSSTLAVGVNPPDDATLMVQTGRVTTENRSGIRHNVIFKWDAGPDFLNNLPGKPRNPHRGNQNALCWDMWYADGVGFMPRENSAFLRYCDADGDLGFKMTNDGSPIQFIMTREGYFGIGTTSPQAMLDIAGTSFIVEQPSTPASSRAPCRTGQIQWDPNYVFVCIATNTWKRASLSSW